MKREIFVKLYKLFKNSLKEKTNLYNLLTFIIINNLDKDLILIKDVFKIIDLSLNVINHDKIVYKVVKTDLILYIRRLNLKYKKELFLNLKLNFILNDE